MALRAQSLNLPHASRALSLVLALTLVACATDASRSAFRRSEADLEAAREQAQVECADSQACAQAWGRARLFVQRHSVTPIERLDDDTIETRMPHEFGVAYFWATRLTADDGTAVIRLKGLCRGMYSDDGGPGWTYRTCAAQLREVQIAFAREVGSAH
ncbi:hypothetical protein [Paraburkholderia sp. J67]|uniref:hypothetical protein n=1 Tax=Paraburkholderia sp. J67 TaxID=2805435 RepID=UPI002ABD8A93|nr:hypothetical protein [Paraburkholderia sp. J67]